jgi:hypothetical protein
MCESEGLGLCLYEVVNQGHCQTAEGFKELEKNNPRSKMIQTLSRYKEVSARSQAGNLDHNIPAIGVSLS